jgi:hypothetical protein
MRTNSKFGWAMALAGLLLLLAFDKLALLLVLIPAATILAFGVLWLGPRSRGVTQGLK